MYAKTSKNNFFAKCIYAAGALLLLILAVAGNGYAGDNALVIYYSRTGKSEVVAKTIAGVLESDIVRIRDLKDRSGKWGFLGAAYDSQMSRYTKIEPPEVDLSGFSEVYIVTPIWNWKLSMPIRTLLHTQKFDGKRMTIVTTANIDIKKYDGYDDNAPFLKRFLRNYLRGKRKEMITLVKSSHAVITGHFHIATAGLSDEQIEAQTSDAFLKYTEMTAGRSMHRAR